MPPVPRGWLALGFDAGWPPEVVVVCCFELELCFWVLGCEVGCCCFVPPPEGFGELPVDVVVFFGGLEGVDVEVGVEVEVEVVGGGAEVVVGGGEEVVVVAAGGQDSETLATPPGRFRLEMGAPTGSDKESVCPVIKVTVTVQSSADAVGIAAIPVTAKVTATATAPTVSFRLLNNVA